MASSSLFEVEIGSAKAIFMLGADDDAKAIENVDVEVALDDGSRWSATFLTLAEIERIMKRWKKTKECLSGAYFQCSDLVVVDQKGVGAATELLRRLIESGQIREVFVRVDIEE